MKKTPIKLIFSIFYLFNTFNVILLIKEGLFFDKNVKIFIKIALNL